MSPKHYLSSIPTWGCTTPALPSMPASSGGSYKDRLRLTRHWDPARPSLKEDGRIPHI